MKGCGNDRTFKDDICLFNPFRYVGLVEDAMWIEELPTGIAVIDFQCSLWAPEDQ